MEQSKLILNNIVIGEFRTQIIPQINTKIIFKNKVYKVLDIFYRIEHISISRINKIVNNFDIIVEEI